MNATFRERLLSLPFYVLPHHAISWLMYKLARVRWTPFKNLAIRVYTKLHTVNMDEAVVTDKYAYESLNAFFTRALNPECRPMDSDAANWICPVDGSVSQAGAIEDGQLFQAKGCDYSLVELLGGNDVQAAPYTNGHFATLYLSPGDYHRIHMPVDATLHQMIYVPGRLYSVATHTVKSIPRLFARNERIVCLFKTEHGPMAMVLVGAINVSAMETVWHGLVTAEQNGVNRFDYDHDISLKRGEEMGRFNLGSTVILITTDNFELDDAIKAGAAVRLGQKIGCLKNT